MSEKQVTEVVIDGRAITLTGDAEAEYMQAIADYVNGKIRELQEGANYNRQTAEDRRLMLLLNIADDYYQEKKRADVLEHKNAGMEDDIDNLRHELVRERMQREGNG